MTLFLCQVSGKTSQSSASRAVPPSTGKWREAHRRGSQPGIFDEERSTESPVFFSSCVISRQSELVSGSSVIGSGSGLSTCEFLSEMKKLQGLSVTRECRECKHQVQDVFCNKLRGNRCRMSFT